MSADTPRPIWIYQGERDLLAALFDGERDALSLGAAIVRRFDAAPANPAEAVADVLDRESGDLARERHLIRDAVLRALGHPDA